LAEYKEINFIKLNSNSDFEKYAKKQGLEYSFLNCENRMWKINKRTFASGLQFGGGSDWFILNSNFIDYILSSNDEYLQYLKDFYKYTLLPSEVSKQINFNLNKTKKLPRIKRLIYFCLELFSYSFA